MLHKDKEDYVDDIIVPATVAGRLTERSELRKESHDVYLVFFDAFPSLWRQLQDPAALSLCTVTVSRW